MKPEEIKDGEAYWCCEPSIETENYGDHTPVMPRQMKAEWTNNPGGRVLYLRCFNKLTGDIDYDSNATVITDPGKVFLLRTEAVLYYKRAVLDHARGLVRSALELLDALDTLE